MKTGNRKTGLGNWPRPWLLLVAAFCLQLSAFAQGYAINWYKISGGGGTSSGGAFSVCATLGQQDAGTMSGGPYTLTGGFWSLVSLLQTPGLPPLSIAAVGPSIKISWPNTVPCTLQQTTNLLTLNSWVTSNYSISTANGTNSVTISSPSGSLFFRLTQ